jgi:flagellar hook protein FlgE
MVLKALSTGVSGLRAEGEAIGVVSDNISNVNTTGFKRQRAIFQDVLGHSILAGTSAGLPGSGVRVGKIQQLFTQGTLSNTGVATDLALNGDGFFVVKGTVEGLTSNFYTRAGEFTLDKEGYLVNPTGLKLQGYIANGDGTFAASLSDVRAPTAAIPPRATTGVDVAANLDSGAMIVQDPLNITVPPTPIAFDPQDPSNTSNFSTTISVYDDFGNAHTLDVYFQKMADNSWDWHALVPDAETSAPAGPPAIWAEVGTGTLTFNDDPTVGTVGSLLDVTANQVSVQFAGVAAAQDITLNFGSPTAPSIAGMNPGTGLDGLTQFGSPSNVSSQHQDGYASGDFSGIAVDGQGVVMGLYTNGQQLAISQLGIAKFRSNDGLERAGNNMWLETRESGTAAMGTAASGGRGAVSSGALEGSNVDLAEEFVGLIIHQRSFSANSKTISTADDMLQELINIKR